jgi:hypothetical protein
MLIEIDGAVTNGIVNHAGLRYVIHSRISPSLFVDYHKIIDTRQGGFQQMTVFSSAFFFRPA